VSDPIKPDDVRAMRQRIFRAHRVSFERIDGKQLSPFHIARGSAIVRHVLNMAEIHGWSGEDTMTAMAYHALLGLEAATDRLLEGMFLTPAEASFTGNQAASENPSVPPATKRQT